MRRLILPIVILATLVLVGPPANPAPPGMVRVPSTLETVPTGAAGDTADDPAIWVNTTNTPKSLVITNEKHAEAMSVFDLQGRLVQRITSPAGFYGNVDVRGRIVAGSHSGILLWRVTGTPAGPRLIPTGEPMGNAPTGGEGLCMWDPGAIGVAGGLYVVNVQRTDYRVRVHRLTDSDGDGLLLVEPAIREFYLPSEGEGCEVVDSTGALYIAEEDAGIWRYVLTAPGGDPEPPGSLFAETSPTLTPDVEGVAATGGVLYASAQNVAAPRFNWYSRYNAATGAYLGSFRVTDGTDSDDCDQTDGIDAYAGYLSPQFPEGLFVCQDGFNDAPGTSGTQNFKYVPLDRVDG